jgi:hypothetical protein
MKYLLPIIVIALIVLPRLKPDEPTVHDELAAYFYVAGDTVEADDNDILATTDQLRTFISRSGRLRFGDELLGRYDGFSEAVDGAFDAFQLGHENVPLKSGLAANIMRAIGKACEEAGE